MVKEYLLSISIAAIICSIIKRIIEEKNTNSKLIKMICGIFMSVIVVTPILNFRMGELKDYFGEFQSAADHFTDQGVLMGKDARNDIILEQTRAYILSEASKMDAQIEVDVELSEDDPPVPVSLNIKGTISPYNKSKLTKLFTNQLNIAGENIRWT